MSAACLLLQNIHTRWNQTLDALTGRQNEDKNKVKCRCELIAQGILPVFDMMSIEKWRL